MVIRILMILILAIITIIIIIVIIVTIIIIILIIIIIIITIIIRWQEAAPEKSEFDVVLKEAAIQRLGFRPWAPWGPRP